MSHPIADNETIILLDHRMIFDEVIDALHYSWGKEFCGAKPKSLPGGSNGLIVSQRFNIGGGAFNFLLISPEDAQLFGLLSLAQRAQVLKVNSVLCIAQAVALDESLRAGEIAFVEEAAALPYPALYENRAPTWQQSSAAEELRRRPEHFCASIENIAIADELARELLPHIPQNEIATICTGYAKHPTQSGSLAPWAREQKDQLRAEGLQTLSETPVGAYDFATRNPHIPVVCFNVITETKSPDSTSITQAPLTLIKRFLYAMVKT